MKITGIFCICCILLFGCQSKYRGFSESEAGFYYNLHTIGDGKHHPQKGDFVQIDTKVKTIEDSLLFHDQQMSFKLENTKDGDLQEALSLLYEGDSATFIFHRKVENADTVRPVKMDVFLKEVKTPEEIAKENWRNEWKNDREMNEQIALKKYLEEQAITEENYIEGMYYIPLRRTDGARVETGKTVHIHYRGYFLNGKEFDSTYNMRDPFEFTFGDPDQVIRGLEIGLSRMKEGEKAKFIIPSQLAFGARGSSTGIVPPFTSVVYEVELIKIM